MKEILDRITPKPVERKKNKLASDSFLKKLNANLRYARASVEGSSAKDTWLAGNHDTDIFVLYEYKRYASKSTELSDMLEPVLKKTFPKMKISRLHGSRDYFQLNYEHLSFEVIPILKITKSTQAKNITDISPLHSIWINKKTKKLKDDIRLVKQFCRAQKVYGAESYLGSFSGYVLEILIAYYGSFQKFLQAAVKWKVKEIIDPENYYHKKDVFLELNKSKLLSPLIVIDPVDKNRNAAAALTLEKFIHLKQAAATYLKKPGPTAFEVKPISLPELKKKVSVQESNLVVLNVSLPAGKEDVVGIKIIKVFEFIKKALEPFDIKESGWEWPNPKSAFCYFIVAKKELPKEEIRIGPPLEMKHFVADFKKKYQQTTVQQGKVIAKVKTPYPQLADFVRFQLKNTYLKQKVKNSSYQIYFG